MNEIKLQSNDVFGKSVSDLEKQISESKGKPVITAQLKDRLLPLGIILLFIIMLAVICDLKFQVSSLQATISQLNSDNALIKSQLDAQVEQVVPATNAAGDKTAEGFIYHVVQAGDCFETISEQYYQADDYASKLAKLNGSTIKSILHVGQVIRVPKNKADLTKEP